MAHFIALTAYFSVALTHPHITENIMIDRQQFKEMIEEVLETAPDPRLNSPTAVNLLLLTAATESHLGSYFRQINGPALGVFQMEPATEQDIYTHFLSYPRNAMLMEWVDDLRGNHHLPPLKYNIAYQIAMARIHYWRVREPLPENTIESLAYYYKRYYNTHKGKGSVEKAVIDYNKYAMGR